MRLVYLLAFLLSPGIAHAEVFSTIALYVAAAATTVGYIAQVVLMVGSAIYGSAQQRKAQKKARDEFNAALTDRTVSNITSEGPFRYVYGRAKVGSSVVALFTSGDKDQFKHMVCIHAAHECNAFLEVFVAGKPLGTLDTNGWVTGGDYYTPVTRIYEKSTTANGITPDQTPSGPITLYKQGLVDAGGEGGGTMQGMVAVPYTLSGNVILFDNPAGELVTASFPYATGIPRVRVTKHLGTPGQGVDIGLYNDTGGKWPVTATLDGFCYTVVTLDINQAEFSGGPPAVEVLLEGKKLYDVRSGLTAWTDNPALVIYDYLTGEVCNIDAADLPLAEFITAANVCESDMGGGNRLYTFNGAVTADQAPAPVLEKMAQAMAGGIVSTTWSIWAGKYTAPVLALDQSDIVGSFALTPGSSDSDKYNGVKGQFISAENAYVATDITPYQNATYLAADSEERWTNIDFPYTDTTQRAHNLARIFTEDARNGYTLKATFSLKAWAIKPGQRVTMTSSLFGWNAKVFRVTDKSYSPTSMVELTLKEDAPDIWDLADAVTVDATPNSNLPNPFAVSPLAYLNAPQSGTDVLLLQSDGSIMSRMFVSWPASNQTNTAIEIEWQVMGDDGWQRHTLSGDATQDFLAPVQDNMIYYVRGRVTRPSIGAVSDWRYITHQVVGKTQPPPDVQTFSITNGVLFWPPVLNTPDLAGYMIRFHYGQSAVWSNAAPLHLGVITETQYKPDLIPPGVITMMIKAIDTSGNESINSADITANLGDVIVDNLILTYNDKAAGFPGTKVGCAVVGGNLLANDSGNLFWSNEDAPHWGIGSANYFATATYLPLEYTFDYLVSAAQAGSRLTLATTITAASYNIEFRYGAPGSVWGADASPTFGEDGDRYWASPTEWQTWPGSIENIGQVEIGFRFTAQGGIDRASISALSLLFDVVDETEELDNIPILATGTRLPITKAYRAISNVQLTLQASGGTAVTTMWADKNATLGPLIYCYNAAGTAVAGVIDSRIQGVKG